jgi:hypothetical protein
LPNKEENKPNNDIKGISPYRNSTLKQFIKDIACKTHCPLCNAVVADWKTACITCKKIACYRCRCEYSDEHCKEWRHKLYSGYIQHILYYALLVWIISCHPIFHAKLAITLTHSFIIAFSYLLIQLMACKVDRDSFYKWLLKIVSIDTEDIGIVHSIGIALMMVTIFWMNSIVLIIACVALGYSINRIRRCDKILQAATVLIIFVLIDI